jgi:hypothetical protein
MLASGPGVSTCQTVEDIDQVALDQVRHGLRHCIGLTKTFS